ncbi:MAG: glycosyltransferase [Limisphaerales bacterium]
MFPPSLTLIVSTYNNPTALKSILSRLAEGTRLPDQTIIADDGSHDAIKLEISNWGSTAKLDAHHCWHEDLGFRKNRILNIALSQSTSDYVVFLDGDCLPHRSFIADHCKLAEKGCLVQGRRTFIPEKYVSKVLSNQLTIQQLQRTFRLEGWFKSLRFPWPRIKRDQGFYGLLGCNLAAWREDLIAINGFDETYEGWGIGEDSDLGARLYNLGCHRKFVHGHAIVYHLNHPELPKEHVPASKARLQETIDSKRTRCERGLNQHTSS